MKTDKISDNDSSGSAEAAISSMRKKNVICCRQQCIKRLLDEREPQLRLFPEEWSQLEKKQKEAVLRFAIRICSRWSERTKRGTCRTLSRFEFEDPLLGKVCRKAFAEIINVGEATLARHARAVHSSGGRFLPPRHENEGRDGHHRMASCVREKVIRFFVEIASAIGEESPGRHSMRNENESVGEGADDTPTVFLPSIVFIAFSLSSVQGGGQKECIFKGVRHIPKILLSHFSLRGIILAPNSFTP